MDKEQIAIMRLKEAAMMSEAYYHQPLLLCYSGGKDSDVILELAKMSGIKFEVQHSLTTADAPDTIYHIKAKLKELEADGVHCEITYPVYKGKRTSMWDLIPQKVSPPTRLMRYCCQILKETNANNRMIITGVRWAESVSRANTAGIYEIKSPKESERIILTNDNDDKRKLFESCSVNNKRAVNPIIDWADEDIWEFIESENIKINPLYYCGQSRVGCIGCPMAGKQRISQFAKWPKYKNNYMKSFERMLLVRKNKGLKSQWENAEEVFHWWMEDGVLPGQIGLFDDEEY